MARLMRAEAEGEGDKGMLLVGNVVVNRTKAACMDFKNLRSITDTIYQVQGGNYSFEAVQKGYFYQRSRTHEKRLAKQTLHYWRENPGKFSLWYFNPIGECPNTWYGQEFVGQWKNHCFYQPSGKDCLDVYIGG